ncbi:MAG: Phenylserine dehydratase [Candidatus Heimdallarchaeota archaeon LC_2]|nr:MAG: Phenylserine dehydratase [Candidatus Heimdallarchaeota archaeon LC_2]
MYSEEDFRKAQESIKDYIEHYSLKYSEWLSTELEAEVYLKLECFQPGRSFKIRGATNSLVSQKPKPTRVITASGGNHGVGVATIANKLNIPSLIVLPEGTSEYRIRILEEIGSQTFIIGNSWDDSNNYAIRLAKSENSLYIHAFADPLVIQGQGTVAVEIMDEINEIDAIVASVGGGGLLTGISLAVEAFAKQKEISLYAVETQGANCLNESLKEDKLVELAAITSIAKTLGARKMSEFNFRTLQRMLTNSYVVSDRDAVKSLIDFLNNEKILVEPAMSCIITALFQNKEEFKGKKIVIVVCGSNVTFNEVEKWKNEIIE